MPARPKDDRQAPGTYLVRLDAETDRIVRETAVSEQKYIAHVLRDALSEWARRGTSHLGRAQLHE